MKWGPFPLNNFDGISLFIIGGKGHKKGTENVINQSFQSSEYTFFRTQTYTVNREDWEVL
jgi:hypothetical protein